jgi:cation diffusion facilitator CzcD-associated flavoprotein CzcO
VIPTTKGEPETAGPVQVDPLSDPGLGSSDDALDVDVVIVGAGISGIGAAIELLRRDRPSFVLLESASELGGTWRDNTYPGVAVDIPSISYSFSYETDFPWSRVFAHGPEIQTYVQGCAQKYGVTRHIRYDARVARSRFDEASDRWSTELETGEVLTSRYLISATGLLSQPKLPEIPGLETFEGVSMHTARWDHDSPLSGKRVAMIGTGASAVQIAPEIAPEVAHLSVFQRTAIWVSPRPDRRLPRGAGFDWRRLSPVRFISRFISELTLDLVTFSIVNYRRLPLLVGAVEGLVRFSMRRQVDDPELAERLMPQYGLGCKRPATSNRYLQTFNRDNVALVTEPIARIEPQGVVTQDGALHPCDVLVLATGFLTTERGNGPSFEVVGREGVELGQFWEDHRLQSYGGVSVPGFPNFFLTAGPYSGGFNWFAMLEAHLRLIMACMDGAHERGVTRVEVEAETHERYMEHMWARAEGTVFKAGSCLKANSYYIDRHGDAALPLPHTPWWRYLRLRLKGSQGYRFGSGAES